jgi:hypothetical protein
MPVTARPIWWIFRCAGLWLASGGSAGDWVSGSWELCLPRCWRTIGSWTKSIRLCNEGLAARKAGGAIAGVAGACASAAWQCSQPRSTAKMASRQRTLQDTTARAVAPLTPRSANSFTTSASYYAVMTSERQFPDIFRFVVDIVQRVGHHPQSVFGRPPRDFPVVEKENQ